MLPKINSGSTFTFIQGSGDGTSGIAIFKGVSTCDCLFSQALLCNSANAVYFTLLTFFLWIANTFWWTLKFDTHMEYQW